MATNRRPAKVDVQDLDDADTSRIGTLGSVLGGGEIEVGAPEEVVPAKLRNKTRMVKVRVNDDISQMSYVGGGRREEYDFERGHEYLVPYYIAAELESNGRIWH
jgi:hypothetical protein